MDRLTVKQEKFCKWYARCGNATESYKKAGYAVKSEKVAGVEGFKLLKNPRIVKKLEKMKAKADKKDIADIQEIQTNLTRIIRQGAEEEVIVVEGCGDGVSEAVTKKKRPALKEVIKAAELLAKMQGGLVNNVNVTGSVPVVIKDDLHE